MTTETLIAVKNDRMTQLRRIDSLFFSPRRLFEDILHNRSWWLPFVLTIVCSYTLTFSAAQKIGFRQLTINAMQVNPAASDSLNEDMTPAQRESAIDTAVITFKISSFITPVVILLYNVVYALALWIGLSLAAKGRADFASIFAVLLYADLIQDVRSLLATIMVYVTAVPAKLNITNAVGTNLAYYLDSGVGGWLRTLLETMDALTIWYLVIIALGCSIVAKVPRRAAAVVVFGLWLLVVVSRVIWAAIG